MQTLVQPETAGDPMSEQKWVRSSLRHLSERLKELGYVLPVLQPWVVCCANWVTPYESMSKSMKPVAPIPIGSSNLR
ncbi:MAG: hypothetical protein J2P37_24810 [Ktedonobacteraceae bacterium]|nr:hypothetical protein [Ktedonobacteraceae bacterium]MBO0789477.1 hypothetical protein [Ktedonobacteraceae bacterium]